jgi:hypothetical protein
MAAPVSWEQARDWLHTAGVPYADSLLDMASSLHDGVKLCELANRISPGSVPMIHMSPTLQVCCLPIVSHGRSFLRFKTSTTF